MTLQPLRWIQDQRHPFGSNKKCSGGDPTSKCCGLGLAGFPHGLRRVAAPAVSLYDRAAVSPSAGLDYHLVHTLIPVTSLSNSLGIFFYNTPSPSPFCSRGFRSHLPRPQLAGFLRGILDGCVHCFIHHVHSRQATLHTTPHHVSASHAGLHCAVAMLLTLVQPPRKRQASSEAGSSPTCHCGSPFLPAGSDGTSPCDRPNPQHQPPIGHRRPTPETSSMCPLTDF